jgi:hypothetical protein
MFMKLSRIGIYVFFLWFILSSCKKTPPTIPIEDISTPPVKSAADEKYAGVFSALEGTWEGIFSVYEDSLGQTGGFARPEDLINLDLSAFSLRLMQTVEVSQEYVSQSPYFQRVTIWDTYTAKNGEQRVIVSRGVNKVQNGQLWCVVVKPDETVIHRGRLLGKHTIAWQRDLRDPLKIEYFTETVEGDFYKILGWGYYGNDNPELSPKTWFVGDYYRVQ